MNLNKNIIIFVIFILILLVICLLNKNKSEQFENLGLDISDGKEKLLVVVNDSQNTEIKSLDERLKDDNFKLDIQSYFYKNFFIDKSVNLKNKSSMKCPVKNVTKEFKGDKTTKEIDYSVINIEFKNNSIEFKKGLIHMGLMSMLSYFDTINSIFQDESNFVNLEKRINLDNMKKETDYLSNENVKEEINDFYEFIKENFEDCINEENSYLNIYYDINLKNHIIVNSVFTKTEKENDMIDVNYTSKFFILTHTGYKDLSSDKKINIDKLVIRLLSNYKSGRQLFGQILNGFLKFEQLIDKDHVTNIQEFLKKMEDNDKNLEELKTYLNNYKKGLDKNNTISYWFLHIINNFLIDLNELETKDKLIETFANPECKDKTLNDGSEYVDNNINSDLAFTCDDYEDKGMCLDGKTTDKYIKVTNNIDNMEAKDACCECGGGEMTNEPSPSPTPSPTFDFNYYDDNTIKIELTPEVKIKLTNILKSLIKIDEGDIEISTFGNSLVINIDNIDTKKIENTTIFNIQNKIQIFFINHYKKLGIELKKERIVIDFVPGSLIISVKILKEEEMFNLTPEEKDLFEYYNYLRVFHRGLKPMTEHEYKKITQNKIKNQFKL